MTLLKVMCMAYLIIFSKGDQCKDNQHCSECNRNGSCLTKCDTGYFDQKCRSACSKTCRNHSCRLSVSGIGYCTQGCVPGYQGHGCNAPCVSPGGSCTACPGGCDGGYCQLGSSCVSGCVDSYYGTDCKSCSSRCKSCNRMTGSCRECHPEYFGPNCGYSCDHCLGSCEHGCTGGCLPGFYGAFCDKTCSEKCGPDPNISTDKPLLAPNTGVRDCYRDSGECIHGCEEGWYGRQCSSVCSSNCRNYRCQSDSGWCTDGCARGFYGGRCHLTCKVCRDGVCDQKTGACSNGCHLTGRKCDSTCTFNCSLEECLRLEHCNQEVGSVMQVAILSTSILFVVVASLVAVALCCRRRMGMPSGRRIQSINQAAEPSHDDQVLPDYWEIREEDVAIRCELPVMNRNDSVTGAAALPVLAECFAPDCDDAVNDVATSEQSAVDDDTYSKLMWKDVVERPDRAGEYLSPIED